MYRVFLFLIVLTCCSAKPIANRNRQRLANKNLDDDSEVIGHAGGGYSYFANQNIDMQPSSEPLLDISDNDLSAYKYSSAFASRPSTTPIRSYNNNQLYQNYKKSKSNFQMQQPKFTPKDFAQISNGYSYPQGDMYNNQQQQRMLFPQQKTVNSFDNQQAWSQPRSSAYGTNVGQQRFSSVPMFSSNQMPSQQPMFNNGW